MIKKALLREEIKDEYKWKITDIYEDDCKWEEEYALLKSRIDEISEFENKVCESSKSLLNVLEKNYELSMIFERVYVYANQKLHENMENSKYLEYVSMADNLNVLFSEKTSFIEPEILEMDSEKILSFIEENDELKLYELALLRILKEKEHSLSKTEEKLLAKVSDISEASEDIFSMFNNADASFGTVRDEDGNERTLTHGLYSKLMESRNREVRKEAFRTLYKEYSSHKNTLSALYYSNVKKSRFYSSVRNYSSSRNMYLSRNYIPETVYDNLIDAVHEYLPAMYKYVSIRKRVLGVDKLHMYDVYTPLTKEFDMKIPYETAKEMVIEGLSPMGEDYINNLKKGLSDGWVDVYENKGKRSGAYSWGPYGTHPYVLLNYQDNLNNVFTLAHEMGHALHSYYSDKKQPYIYAGYKIFVAEVASTCNESLLIHHLLEKTKDREEKIFLLNYFIDQFKGTIFRQTMFAEFEKIVHEKVDNMEGLNADTLCDIYKNLNSMYYGNEMEEDKEIEMEWSRIPHFYNPFYVYQYATGFSAAIALSKRILMLGEEGVKDYMQFLEGGNSKEPIELLKLAGVDMNEKETIKNALELFSSLVDELEKLI